MRRLVFLALFALQAIPAGAVKRVTVAQLERTLAAAAAARKPEAEIARMIGGIELSERLTETTLSKLDTQLNAGPKIALALQLLADQSAFLDPPASELPGTAIPDTAALQKMLEAARGYVLQTLPRLPNFLATRTINQYDDSPQEVTSGGWPTRAGLHLVGTSSREVSVRDERENQLPSQSSVVWKEQSGLISGGEFGSTLGMILTDAAQGKVTWAHWEQGTQSPVAVLQYSVPKAASHFEIMGTRRGRQHWKDMQRQRAPEGLRGSGSLRRALAQQKSRSSIPSPGITAPFGLTRRAEPSCESPWKPTRKTVLHSGERQSW